MIKKLKGKDVTVKLDGTKIASSTSCTFNLNANTTDVSTKDDANSDFENVEFQYYAWDVSNESFAVSRDALITLLQAWLNGDAVMVDFAKDASGEWLTGEAFITSLGVTASKDGYATVSLSLTGNGALEVI